MVPAWHLVIVTDGAGEAHQVGILIPRTSDRSAIAE